MAQPRFEVVDEEQATSPTEAPPRELGLLLLGLKTLSQRAVAAAVGWFTILSAAGTWWLWYSIPDPNPNQIVALSIFAAFVLAANWLVRRK